MRFFQTIEAMINSMAKDIANTANSSDIIKSLALLIGVSITLEIIITGFKVYAGKTETPTKDLIWSISLKLILVLIALDHGGYLTAIQEALNELQNAMSGKESMFVVMDEKVTQTLNLTNALGRTIGWTDMISAKIIMVNISTFLVWIGFFLGIFSCFLLLATTKLTLVVLLLVAPLVIFLKAYSFGKEIFNQWLGAILTNFITIFILGSIFTMFSRKYGEMVNLLAEDTSAGDILLVGVNALVAGIILMTLTKIATSVAEQLGKVSLEGIGNGIAKATQNVASGAAAGAGGGAASSIGKASAAMSAATGPAGIAMALGKGVLGATGSATLGAVKGGLKSSFGKK